MSDCDLFILALPSKKKADECKVSQSNEIITLSISWVSDQLQGSKSFKRNLFKQILMKYIQIRSIMTIMVFTLHFVLAVDNEDKKITC